MYKKVILNKLEYIKKKYYNILKCTIIYVQDVTILQIRKLK